MSDKKSVPSSQNHNPRPFSDEKGLQPAKNPPAMPQVKPPKGEKGS
jgi:hypothetical protein